MPLRQRHAAYAMRQRYAFRYTRLRCAMPLRLCRVHFHIS